MFKPTTRDCAEHWRDDGYKWKHQGTTRWPRNRTPLIQKKYLYLLNNNGTTNTNIRKDVFCLEQGTDPNNMSLVHYFGEVGKILDEGKFYFKSACIIMIINNFYI